jgi:hypothetical protein
MSLKSDICDMRMDPPAGDWDEELNERIEDTRDECDVCGEKVNDEGYFTCNCYSPCCGARMIDDSDICPDCREHT